MLLKTLSEQEKIKKKINNNVATIKQLIGWNHLTNEEVVLIALDSLRRDVKEIVSRGYLV